jgi:hypothetical protein
MNGGMDSGGSAGLGAGAEPALSLRELFASMSHGGADPATALAQAGHGDLPGHLVTEAIINYADAAPVEVAEHLSPYVVANSAVPAPDGQPYPVTDVQDGFSLLSTAPDPIDTHVDDPYGVPADTTDHLDDASPAVDIDALPAHDTADQADPSADHDAHHGDGGEHADLWFGHGQASALAPVIGEPISTDDPSSTFSAGHTDPWLLDPADAAAEHPADDAVPLFGEGVEPHGTDAHDAGHSAQPLQVDPAEHHHDIDPGA